MLGMDLQSLWLLAIWDGKESEAGDNFSCHQGTPREKRWWIVMCQLVLIIQGLVMEFADSSGLWFLFWLISLLSSSEPPLVVRENCSPMVGPQRDTGKETASFWASTLCQTQGRIFTNSLFLLNLHNKLIRNVLSSYFINEKGSV